LQDEDDQDPPLESSSEGSPTARSKCICQEFHLVWDSWNDGMISKEVKQVKVIEVLSIKEVVEGNLDDQKEEMRYVCLYLIKLSHVI